MRTLAILPLTNAAASAELDWMREGLADMLVTDLAQSRYVRPVPGERVLRVLKDIGAEAQTRFDASALEAISKRAPAQTVLYGQFVQSGDTVRLDLSLRQAGSGVTQPIKAEAKGGDVLSLVDHIATAVKQQLDLTPEQIKGDVARPFSEVATSSVDALRLFHEGAAALRAGSVQDAIAKLRDATAKDAGFAMAWTRLAEAYADAGEQREAESAAERAQTLAEKAPLPLAQRYQIHAAVATVKEDLETAAKSYRELAALYPEDPDVQYRLAATLRGLGQQPEAITAYQKVLQLSPGYGAAEIELAGVMWQAGRSEDAIRMLQETLGSGRFKDDTEALGTIHSILGNAYRDTAQLDKALESLQLSLDYRRKAGDKRGQVVTLTNLASLHEQAGAIPKAIAAEKEALRIAREMRDRARESFVLHNMGMTYSSAGDLQRSLQAFRDSLQIEMERGNASEIANRLDKVADAYRLMGRYDDALVYLEQAKAQLAKTDAKQEVAINQQYFGQVYAAQGRFAEALTAFQAALPVFQEINQPIGVGMAHSGLAEVYTRQGRYADAWTSLSTALDTYTKLKAEHDIAEVKAPLGRLAALLGRTDEAEALIADTAKFAGHGHAGGVEIDVQLAQAELLRLRGKAAEAAEVLEHAITQARASAHLAHATEASVALARLRLAQGNPAEALTLATRARLEAEKLRRRPVEAEALATLAAAQATLGRAEPARRSALDAISLAEKYEGRPVLVMARAALARALEKLGRPAEATDAWARAAADLDWIRGSLKPEHAQAFMARADIQSFLGEALPRLEKAGRGADTAAPPAVPDEAEEGCRRPLAPRAYASHVGAQSQSPCSSCSFDLTIRSAEEVFAWTRTSAPAGGAAMWRWTKRILIGLAGLVVIAAIAGATYQWIATRRDLARTPAPGRLVDIGGHRLHIWCSGSGTPPVILETGLGGSSADWGFVQPEVAGFTKVCSYDRAGMGYSDPGPSPRTTRRIGQYELAQLLDRTGVAGRVVLVGASIGGLAVRLFASEHPERVAGLVLVDASHEDQDVEVPRVAPFVPLLSSLGIFRLLGVTFGPPPATLAPTVRPFAEATGFRAAAYQAAVDEFTHLRQSAAEVKATRRQLSIPVVVVTAGRGADAAWLEAAT